MCNPTFRNRPNRPTDRRTDQLTDTFPPPSPPNAVFDGRGCGCKVRDCARRRAPHPQFYAELNNGSSPTNLVVGGIRGLSERMRGRVPSQRVAWGGWKLCVQRGLHGQRRHLRESVPSERRLQRPRRLRMRSWVPAVGPAVHSGLSAIAAASRRASREGHGLFGWRGDFASVDMQLPCVSPGMGAGEVHE